MARLQNVLTNGAPGHWERTPGPVDETFGARTRAAVEAFQEWAGLPASGVVDEQTWAVEIPSVGTTLEDAVGLDHVLDASA